MIYRGCVVIFNWEPKRDPNDNTIVSSQVFHLIKDCFYKLK